MIKDSAQDDSLKRGSVGELIAYFALAFAISWGLGAGVIFFRPQFEALFGRLGPPLTSWPYYVAVSAPTISAVLLSLVFYGPRGPLALFAQLLRPCRALWVLIALLTYPTGLLVWGLVERFLLEASAPHSIDIRAIFVTAPLLWLTTPALLVDPGPWGEETGWRGFALPRLLSVMSPLAAAILLGVIWAVWHAPAFLVSGLTQFGVNFGWFFVGVTCLSVVMTWIYVHSNRNYFVAGMIPHAVNNITNNAHAILVPQSAGPHAMSGIEIQALVVGTIAILIAAFSGPSLRGWRSSPPELALQQP